MIQPPSVQREYSEFWSGDPAIMQSPDAPPEDATEETKAAVRARVEEHERKLERARETGQWDAIIVPGERPTMFTFAPIPGRVMRALISRMERGELDFVTAAPIAFRASIRKIENPAMEIKVENHPEFGRIASEAITNKLDAIDMGIVSQLGMRALSRGTTGIAPKS